MKGLYAIQGKITNDCGESYNVVRLIPTGEKPTNDLKEAFAHVATIYGKLQEQTETESKIFVLNVRNENKIVAHLWDCYTYEQYKEVYEKEIVKV